MTDRNVVAAVTADVELVSQIAQDYTIYLQSQTASPTSKGGMSGAEIIPTPHSKCLKLTVTVTTVTDT